MRLRLRAVVVVLLVSLFVAVMIPCMYNRYIQGETLYYISKVDNFRKENKTLPRGGVVFVGDSITDFCDLDKFYPGLNAVNRGIAGDVTYGVLRRMEESVYALAPELVVLLIGINDIARAHLPETTLENIREKYPRNNFGDPRKLSRYRDNSAVRLSREPQMARELRQTQYPARKGA